MNALYKSFAFLALAIVTISCEKIIYVESQEQTGEKGAISFQFQKPLDHPEFHYLTYKLSQTGGAILSDTIDISSGLPQTIELNDLPIGTWALRIDALDQSYAPRYSGTTYVEILSGETTTADIILQPVSGNLIINIKIAGKSGNAIYLDGNGSYVEVANSETINSLTNDFTIEAWVLPVEQSYNTIIAKGISTFMIEMVPGNYAGFYFKGITIDPLSSWIYYDRLMLDQKIPTTNWAHVACTFSKANGQVSLFYNGRLIHSASATGSMIYDQESIRIGSRPYHNDDYRLYFKGSIDEVRIWNVARTAGEIYSTYNTPLLGSEAGLVSYHKFDEELNGVYPDYSNNQNHGKPVGNVKLVKSFAF